LSRFVSRIRARTLVTRKALRVSGTTTPVRFSSMSAQRKNSVSSMLGMGVDGDQLPAETTMIDIHLRQS
jgi:hypothetical protein